MYRESSLTQNILLYKLEQLGQKLDDIRERDPELWLFGAETHDYEVYGTLEPAILTVFERLYQVQLPVDYRAFLQYFGDGGAGPYYGLCPLGMSLFADMDYPHEDQMLVPGRPFPLTAALAPAPHNITERTITAPQVDIRAYLPVDDGILRLCNAGNGVFVNLVISGEARGEVWTDARMVHDGIYPGDPLHRHQHLRFLDWYELWLDEALLSLAP